MVSPHRDARWPASRVPMGTNKTGQSGVLPDHPVNRCGQGRLREALRPSVIRRHRLPLDRIGCALVGGWSERRRPWTGDR